MYVYRFLDSRGQVLYVGKTVDISRRIREHFGGKGHLSDKCYSSVYTVEYMKFPTEVDSLIAETYFINLWKPPYNKMNKGNSDKKSTLIKIDPNFKLYRVIKGRPCTKKDNPLFSLLVQLGFWGIILYFILKMFLLI